MGTALPPPLSVGLCFAQFRRYLIVREPDPSEPPLTDKERRRLLCWEVTARVSFLLIVPTLTFVWFVVLKGGAGLFHRETAGTRFLIQPCTSYWLVPSLFLALITSIVLMDTLWQAVLRERYRRSKIRGFMVITTLIVAGAAVAFVGGATSFTRFTEAGIEVRRPFSFRSRFYGYDRVRAVEHRATGHALDGKFVERPYHVVRFDDGTSWSTREGLRDPVPDVDERVAQLVSRRSGRPIVERP